MFFTSVSILHFLHIRPAYSQTLEQWNKLDHRMATCVLLPITISINLTISQCFKDMHDEFLSKRLDERKEQQLLRSLRLPTQGIVDFCSNDYLGIVTTDRISA